MSRKTLLAGVFLLTLTPVIGAISPAAAVGRPGTLMVFVAESDGQWDLYSWDPFGTKEPQRLTSTPLDELGPSLSADRETMVYSDSAGHIWVMSLTDGRAKRVTSASEAGVFLQPSISPDGRAVLVARRYEPSEDDTDLAIRELGREGVTYGPAWTLLTESPMSTRLLEMLSSQFSPAWSPGGLSFVFTNLHAKWTGSIISEIWEARVDHSQTRQLTLLDSFCDEPVWSPSGDEIAFSCDQPDQYELYAVDLPSRGIRRLTDHPASDRSPVYSPDGRYLAFVSTRSGQPSIWVMDLSDGSAREMHPFSDHSRPCGDPDWR